MVDKDFVEWATSATKGMKESAMFLSIFDKDISEDPTPVLQLGYALVLDKPILIIAERGTPIPENVKKVAKAIAFFDRVDPESIATAVQDVMREGGITK